VEQVKIPAAQSRAKVHERKRRRRIKIEFQIDLMLGIVQEAASVSPVQ